MKAFGNLTEGFVTHAQRLLDEFLKALHTERRQRDAKRR
jgi:hypothetical protein